jgi:hypothetical protein
MAALGAYARRFKTCRTATHNDYRSSCTFGLLNNVRQRLFSAARRVMDARGAEL